jgi:hypothetical protein
LISACVESFDSEASAHCLIASALQAFLSVSCFELACQQKPTGLICFLPQYPLNTSEQSMDGPSFAHWTSAFVEIHHPIELQSYPTNELTLPLLRN